MRLPDYIKQLGDDKAAALWGVKRRTIESWRLGKRKPRPWQAAVIVQTSPVTYEGIYAPQEEVAAA
jgi:hypothetical protein